MKIEVEDLKTISLKEGDTLVVRFSEIPPGEALKEFKDEFRRAFPTTRLMLIPDTVEIYKLISEEN